MSNNKYVVMSERDTYDWRNSTGPIIHETLAVEMAFEKARERSQSLTRYGRAQIFLLVRVCAMCGHERPEEDHACAEI